MRHSQSSESRPFLGVFVGVTRWSSAYPSSGELPTTLLLVC